MLAFSGSPRSSSLVGELARWGNWREGGMQDAHTPPAPSQRKGGRRIVRTSWDAGLFGSCVWRCPRPGKLRRARNQARLFSGGWGEEEEGSRSRHPGSTTHHRGFWIIFIWLFLIMICLYRDGTAYFGSPYDDPGPGCEGFPYDDKLSS